MRDMTQTWLICMTRSYMGHKILICVTWLRRNSCMDRRYVGLDPFICVAWLRYDSFVWLLHVWGMTQSFVYMCDMTQTWFTCIHLYCSFIWGMAHLFVLLIHTEHDSFICVTCIHSCDMTHLHGYFMCGAWLIHLCDMHAFVWHDVQTIAAGQSRMMVPCAAFICVAWLICVCDMTQTWLIDGSFICRAWLIDIQTIAAGQSWMTISGPAQCHITHMNESRQARQSCYTYKWDTSITLHIWMSHVCRITHMDESRPSHHTHERVTSMTCSVGTCSISDRAYEWVTSQI